jgi:hypothetical protein
MLSSLWGDQIETPKRRCRSSAAGYWLPRPFCWPQSGHCQVMPLQESPQKFSSMHSWQMAKPQRQVQQKGTCWAQQWHTGLR